MSETTLQTTHTSARNPVAVVLAATAAAVAIWIVATLAGAELTVSLGGQPIQKVTVINVIVAALVGSLAGWGLLALLRRFTINARAIWTVIAIVFALFSLGGPLTATASTGTKVALVAMHLTVATVTIVGLRRTRGR